jgi:hypothetical protein
MNKNICKFLFFLLSFLAANICLSQNYFQQDVKYTIHVKLNDTWHELSADETIQYTNNSPDSLPFLYFHLWPNAYKNNSTALAKQLLENGKTFFYYADDSLRGYIDSLDFKVNDKTVRWKFDEKNIDICQIILNEPLKSGESITITTPFHVKLPDSRISRMGHDGQSYQVSQWFPKPAVYDAKGWNQMPYLDQGEFYSEFGTFDVFITLPENYVVGATGDIVNNQNEIDWLNNKASETAQIKSFNKFDFKFPASSEQTKTLHYHQEKVHDFAWFADKRYHVLKGEVVLPYSSKKVTTWVMFTNRYADQWRNGLEYVNDAVYYYSKWIGEYPYKQATAVEGALSAGGGMEYPNITVISSAGDSLDLEMVIMHEVGHNWFYGILGSNERKNPWMDEGINSFYEFRYLQTKYPGSTLMLHHVAKILHLPKHPEFTERTILYNIAAHLNNDQPIGLPAEQFSQTNYGGIVYEKTSAAFTFLKNYLGDQKFDNAMQEYFSQWKFKHPQPANLQSIMEFTVGEKLDWFFNDMINSTKKVDYKICNTQQFLGYEGVPGKSLKVKIKNKGKVISPFQISEYINDSLVNTQWVQGFEGKKNIFIRYSKTANIQINADNACPEYNIKNNYILVNGLFKKLKPLKIQLLPGIDDPEKTQICTTPVIGFNLYNGLMPGIAVYNNPFPLKKFSYFIMPMYGFKSKTLAGYSNIGFNILPSSEKIQMISLGLTASHFAYANEPFIMNFSRLVPQINIKLKNKNPRSRILKEITFRNINIRKEIASYKMLPDSSYLPVKENSDYYLNQLQFLLINTRKINPYSFNISAEQGLKFLRTSIEATYCFSYNKPRKTLDIRTFFGCFVYKDGTVEQDFRYKLSGLKGYRDNTFDHYFIGRSEGNGLPSQQFCVTDGGFKAYTPLGQTWDWLLAANFKTSIPGKIPLKLFADIGVFPDKNKLSGSSLPVYYDAGIQFTIINNIFEIYFPLAMSKDITDVNKNIINNYFQSIRFTLNLEKADPFKLLRDIR